MAIRGGGTIAIDRHINNCTALSGKSLNGVLHVRLNRIFPSGLEHLIMSQSILLILALTEKSGFSPKSSRSFQRSEQDHRRVDKRNRHCPMPVN